MFRYKISFLDLSLNTYLGIILIAFGFFVRIEFKIGVQKDIQ